MVRMAKASAMPPAGISTGAQSPPQSSGDSLPSGWIRSTDLYRATQGGQQLSTADRHKVVRELSQVRAPSVWFFAVSSRIRAIHRSSPRQILPPKGAGKVRHNSTAETEAVGSVGTGRPTLLSGCSSSSYPIPTGGLDTHLSADGCGTKQHQA